MGESIGNLIGKVEAAEFYEYPGHSDKLCQYDAMNMEESTPIGPWIRSNQYGRRVMEEKDRKFH
ncbi:hypothetical protein A2U01_0040127, partial [Trifolium medium]|nr:hypothetical protein [Trifolium medium]